MTPSERSTPAEVPARRPRLAGRAWAALTSPRLALGLLVTVLACCVVGVTALRGELGWRLIFSTLWFNALLVLLAVSSAAAFFTRVGRRRLTLLSAGMIVFHLSFAALLGAVVFNGLVHFRGVLRLTEGETLANGAEESYDVAEYGRWFDFGRLRGETTLVRMHRSYRVDGQDKRAAYELEQGEPGRTSRGITYVNGDLERDGVRYIPSKEGYSVLVVLSDRAGKELFGAHVPLQSIPQADGGFLYATGSERGPEGFPFPPEEPRVDLLVTYRPSAVAEREGEVTFRVRPVTAHGAAGAGREGRVIVGAPFDAGDLVLTPREIRYWVGMDVRYDPGMPLILGSLCCGLGGIVLTFVGRVRQGARKGSAPARPDRTESPARAEPA